MADQDEIIRAIDMGQYRQAQVLIQKKIKKFPQKSYYHALNCLCLLRSGKESEAIQESLSLKDKTPSDPTTLSVLTQVFNEMGKSSEAQQIYENAVKKYPNQELIFQWFIGSLQKFDIRTMQKAAMSLQRIERLRRNTFWAAFTYHLVSELPDASSNEKMLYPKIAVKLIDPLQPFKDEQEIYVYVKLLASNKDYEKAIETIESFSKGKKYDLELQVLLLEYLVKSENWSKLAQSSEKILFEDKLDDFDTWKHLIDAYLKLNIPHQEIVTKINTYDSRNSNLVHLEYAIKTGDKDYFCKSLVSYYLRYRTKTCCFNDIQAYMKSDLFDKDYLLEAINQFNDQQVTEKNLITVVNHQKLKYTLNLFDADDFIKENFMHYHHFKPLLKKKSTTDYFPGDEFILMNVQLILNNSSSNFNLDIYKCVTLLEHVMDQDKHEQRLKLLSMKLYSYLNCHTISTKIFKDLKIKMIQNDTLGYTLNTRLATLLPNAESCNSLTNIQKFYLTCSKELEESLLNGFEKTAFNKLDGFIKFGERIEKSIGNWTNILELLRISKITGNKQVQYFCLDTLNTLNLQNTKNVTYFDNRDFKSCWNFGNNKIDTNLEAKISIGPKIDATYLKVYSLIQLILHENKISKSKKFFANLRTILNSNIAQDFTIIEKWSFKIYLAIFTLFLSNPESVPDYNFIIKNLSFNSIKAKYLTNFEKPWEINHNVVTVFEVCRNLIQFTNMNQLLKQDSSKSGEIKKSLQKLLSDLRDHPVQDDLLPGVQDDVESWLKKYDFNISISSTFQKIKDSKKDAAVGRRIP